MYRSSHFPGVRTAFIVLWLLKPRAGRDIRNQLFFVDYVGVRRMCSRLDLQIKRRCLNSNS